MKQIDQQNSVNRRSFLKQSGSVAAGAAVLGRCRACRARRRRQHDSPGADRLRRARHRRRRATPCRFPTAGRSSSTPWPTCTKSRSTGQHNALKKKFGDKVDVPEDRKFVGFDAYRKAIDILRPGDIAMCTTRAYIRPVHVEYAVQKGINVFMEKPFASDPGGLHRLLRAGEEAEKKNVKIAAGLQCRHSPARQALIDKIRDGAMGDIPLIRANRLGGAGWLGTQGDKSNDLMSQLQFGRIHLFWIGSGHMVDYLIHQIDECCWIKDAWPVSCDRHGRTRARQHRLRPEHRRLLDGVHLCRRHQGLLRLPADQQDPQRLRHLHSRHQVRRAVLRQRPRGHGPHVQGPADRQGQHRLDAHRRTPSAPGSTSGTTSSTASATTGRTTKPSGPSTRT